MPYSVAKCPKCSNLQMLQIHNISTDVLRCVTCQSQTKLRKKDMSEVQLFGSFTTPREASILCQQLKREAAKELYVSDF